MLCCSSPIMCPGPTFSSSAQSCRLRSCPRPRSATGRWSAPPRACNPIVFVDASRRRQTSDAIRRYSEPAGRRRVRRCCLPKARRVTATACCRSGSAADRCRARSRRARRRWRADPAHVDFTPRCTAFRWDGSTARSSPGMATPDFPCRTSRHFWRAVPSTPSSGHGELIAADASTDRKLLTRQLQGAVRGSPPRPCSAGARPPCHHALKRPLDQSCGRTGQVRL